MLEQPNQKTKPKIICQMKYIVLLVIKMAEYQIKAYIWVTAVSEEEAEEKLKHDVIVLDIVSTEEMG